MCRATPGPASADLAKACQADRPPSERGPVVGASGWKARTSSGIARHVSGRVRETPKMLESKRQGLLERCLYEAWDAAKHWRLQCKFLRPKLSQDGVCGGLSLHTWSLVWLFLWGRMPGSGPHGHRHDARDAGFFLEAGTALQSLSCNWQTIGLKTLSAAAQRLSGRPQPRVLSGRPQPRVADEDGAARRRQETTVLVG